MSIPRVVVLGGGLSGLAAAYTLARAGWKHVTVVERGSQLGGLAGTFEADGHFYPLAYHHILHRDQGLLYFLDRIGVLRDVRWRKVRMLFRLDGRMYDLADPVDFFRFPMGLTDKLRFVRLMTRCFVKSDWTDWHERSAAELVDAWGGPGVRQTIFDPLTRLKFDRPCDEVSGAWLGARLNFREGSAPLGYIPGSNWTKVLCDGVSDLIERASVRVRAGTSVVRLVGDGDLIARVELDDGESLPADLVVSTVPTEIYRELLGESRPELEAIDYTAIVSAIFTTRQRIRPDFYWMNLASLDCNACGIFALNSLNPTIGGPGETCLNIMSHVRSRKDTFFNQSDEQILTSYRTDFHRVFGFELTPVWSRLNRLPMYSPVFYRGYRNPPLRDSRLRNVYLAGNYRTFPSIASTGTALRSGVETGAAILSDHGCTTDLPDAIGRFRLASMPKG